MKKALIINKFYHPWPGGVERVTQDIAEGLRDKVDLEVLVCQPRGWGKREVINGVKVTRAASLGIFFRMPVSLTFPFLFFSKARRADILHFHHPFPLGVLAWFLCPGLRHKKIILSYHCDIVRQKRVVRLFEPLLRLFLNRVDKILVSSPNLIESSRFLRLFRNKCVVVPFSVNFEQIGPPAKETFDLGVSPGEKVVLCVGRLVYYKGVEYLLEAMPEVNACLLIVGDGALRRELEQRAKTLQVENKTRFLGCVPTEMLKYCYQICDVFVLPSVEPSEAFGIVQMEAMAYGKPVINTNLPTGVPYVSVHNETGFTVAPRDSKGLASAINQILGDRNLAEKFSKNAVIRVKENFSRDKMLGAIRALYFEEIANRKSLSFDEKVKCHETS